MPGTSRGQSWTISSGETVSSLPIELKGDELLVGMDWPAAFTGATASFQVADLDTDTPVDLDWEGVPYQIPVNDGRGTGVDPRVFSGRRFIWIKSSGAEAAGRTIIPRIRRWQ